MGNLGDGHKKEDYEPEDDDFALLPDAWYKVLCTEAELRETNDGKGSYVNCRWDIIGDDYEGRVVFSMITWENESKKAKAIGRGQINTLCEIMDIVDLKDTAQLVTEHPVEIRVKTEEATEDYEAKNVVKRYRKPKIGKAAASSDKKSSSKKGSTPSGPTPDKTKKPWEKNKGA